MPYLLFMIFAFFLSSCGSDHQAAPPPPPSSSCSPATARAGETVICSITSCQEDCTLLVGNRPVSSTCHAEEKTIEFQIPSQASGHVDITIGCGDTLQPVSKGFAIVSEASGCDADSDCPSDKRCEAGSCVNRDSGPSGACSSSADCSTDEACIEGNCVPIYHPQCTANSDCTGGKVCSGGSCVDPGPSTGCQDNNGCTGGNVCLSGMCVPPPPDPPPPPECIDNSGCTGGKICQSGSCVDPPPPPPPPHCTVSLEGTKDLHADTSLPAEQRVLGLIKVKWSLSGDCHDAQIFAPFNRSEADTTCGLEGSRWLAVNDDGTDLRGATDDAPASADFNRYSDYTEGTACGESGCYMFTDPEQKPIYCRMDLHGTSGEFYTRMRQKHFRVTLAGRAGEGEMTDWQSDFRDFEAPAPVITKNTSSDDATGAVDIMDNEPIVKVDFHFKNATTLPTVEGCEAVTTPFPASTNEIAPDGSGNFQAFCKLKPTLWFGSDEPSQTLTLRATGIDQDTTETFGISCGRPVVTLTPGDLYSTGSTSNSICSVSSDNPDVWKECNKRGDLQLYGEVERSCLVGRKKKLELMVRHVGDFGGFGIFGDFGKSAPRPLLPSVPCLNLCLGSQYEIQPGYPKTGPWVKQLKLTGTGTGCPFFDYEDFDPDRHVETGGHKARIERRMPRQYDCTRYRFSVVDLDGTASLGASTYERDYLAPYQPILEPVPDTVRGSLVATRPVCRQENEVDAALSVTIKTQHIKEVHLTGCEVPYGFEGSTSVDSPFSITPDSSPVISDPTLLAQYDTQPTNYPAVTLNVTLNNGDDDWAADLGLDVTCQIAGKTFWNENISETVTWHLDNAFIDCSEVVGTSGCEGPACLGTAYHSVKHAVTSCFGFC